MAVIDERVVQMKFDNRNFEKNVQVSLQTLAKLKDSLNLEGATKSLKNVEKEMNNVSVNTTKMTAVLDKVGQSFSALGAIGFTAMQRITNAAIDAGQSIARDLVKPLKEGVSTYEAQIKAVQVTMNALNKTGVKGEQYVRNYLDDLNKYSDETIYTFQDMTTSLSKFVSAGVKIDAATEAIKGLGNVAALSGASTADFSRAIYNVSQSLGMGKMMTRDWMSIENANMATKEFKEQLIDTGKELGYIYKEGKKEGYLTQLGLSKVNQKMQKTAAQTQITYKNLRDTLSYGWLDNNVLIGTLSKYSDETTKLGKKAKAAAVEVKTFSQLLDTLGDALATKWSKVYTNVVGNFNEAKEFWTWVSNGLEKVLGGPIDALNKATAKWKQSAGRDILWTALKQNLVGLNAFVQTIKIGWESVMPPKSLSLILLQITNAFYKFNTAAAQYILKIAPNLARTTRGVASVAKVIVNVVKAIGRLLKPLGALFLDLIDYITRITGSLGDLLYNINNGLTSTEAFGNIWNSICEVFKDICTIASRVGGKVAKIITTIFDSVSGLVNIKIPQPTRLETFLDNLAAKLDQFKASNPIFTFFDKIINGIKALGQFLAPIGAAFKKAAKNTVDSMADIMSRGTLFSNDIFKMINYVLAGKAFVSLNQFLNNLKTATSGFKEAFKNVNTIIVNTGKAIGTFQRYIKAKALMQEAQAILIASFALLMMSSLDTKGLAVGLAGLAGVMLIFSAGLSSLGKAAKALAPAEKVTGKLPKFVQSLSQLFGIGKMTSSISINMMASSIVSMAFAIYVLSASLAKLAKVDPIQLAASWLFLMLIMRNFKNFVSEMVFLSDGVKGAQFNAMSTGIIGIAIAINIIASAFKKLGEMKFGDLVVGIISFYTVIKLLEEVMGYMSRLSKKGTLSLKMVPMILSMSIAVYAMAAAFKSLGEMNFKQLAVGIVGFFTVIKMLEDLMKEITNLSMDMRSFGSTLKMVPMILSTAIAVVALSSVLYKLGQMKPMQLLRGITGFATVMVAFEMVMKQIAGAARITKASDLSLKMVPMILAVGIVAYALGSTLKLVATTSKMEFVSGLTSFAAIMVAFEMVMKQLAAIATGLKTNGARIAGLVAMMWTFGAVVTALAVAMKIVSTKSWKQFASQISSFTVIVILMQEVLRALSDLTAVQVSRLNALESTLRAFSMAVLLMSVGMDILGTKNLTKWATELGSYAVMVILMQEVLLSLSKLDAVGITSLSTASKSMIAFAGAVAIMCAAFGSMALVHWSTIAAGTIAITALIIVFGKFTQAFFPIIGEMTVMAGVLAKFAGVVMLFAGACGVMAASFLLLVTAFADFILLMIQIDKAKDSILRGVETFNKTFAKLSLTMLALMGTIVVIVKMITDMFKYAASMPLMNQKGMAAFAMSFALVSAGIIAIAGAITLLGLAAKGNAKGIIAAAAALGIIIAAFVGLSAVVGHFPVIAAGMLALSSSFMKFSVAIGILGAAFFAFAASMNLFVEAIQKIGENREVMQSGINGWNQMIAGMAQGIIDNAPIITRAVITVLEQILYQLNMLWPIVIENMFKGIDALCTAIIQYMPTVSSKIMQALITLFDSMNNAINEYGDKLEKSVETFVDNLVNRIVVAIMKGLGRGLGIGMKTANEQMDEAADQATKNTDSKLVQWADIFGKNKNNFKKKASDMTNGAAEGINSSSKNTTSALDRLFGVVNANAAENTNKTAKKTKDNVKKVGDTAESAISDVSKDIVPTLQDAGSNDADAYGSSMYNQSLSWWDLIKQLYRNSAAQLANNAGYQQLRAHTYVSKYSNSKKWKRIDVPGGGTMYKPIKQKKKKNVMDDLISSMPTASAAAPASTGSSSGSKKKSGSKSSKKSKIKAADWGNELGYKPDKYGVWKWSDFFKGYNMYDDAGNRISKWGKSVKNFSKYSKQIAKDIDPKKASKQMKSFAESINPNHDKISELKKDISLRKSLITSYTSSMKDAQDQLDKGGLSKKRKKELKEFTLHEWRASQSQRKILESDEKQLQSYQTQTTDITKVTKSIWTHMYGNTAEYKDAKAKTKTLQTDTKKHTKAYKQLTKNIEWAQKEQKKYNDPKNSKDKAKQEALKKYIKDQKNAQKTEGKAIDDNTKKMNEYAKTIKNGPNKAFNDMYSSVKKSVTETLKFYKLFTADAGESIFEHFQYNDTEKNFKNGKVAHNYAGYGYTQNKSYENLIADRDNAINNLGLSDTTKEYIMKNYKSMYNELHALRYANAEDIKQFDQNIQQLQQNNTDAAWRNYKETKDRMSKWVEKLKELAVKGLDPKALKQIIDAGFSDESDAVADKLLTLLNGTPEQQEEALSLGKKAAGETKDAIINGIMEAYTYSGATDEQKKAFREAIGLSDDNTENTKEEATNTAKEGVGAATVVLDEAAKSGSDIRKASRNLGKSVSTVLKDETKSGGKSAGKNLTKGLAAGIQSVDGVSSAKSAASSLGKTVLASLQKSLKEHSPSKETFKMGGYLAKGMALGIDNSTGMAIKSARVSANRILNGFADVSSVNMDILKPTIAPVIDQNSLLNATGQIQGLVTDSSAQLAQQAQYQLAQNKAINNYNSNLDYDDSDLIDAIRSMHEDMLKMQEVMSQMQIRMDTGAVVGQLAAPMDKALGQRSSMGRR